jgi:hypothetical protein
MRRALFVICGCCWFGFGLGFGLFLLQYIANGAGLQDLSPARQIFGHTVSSGTVLVGLVHIVGLIMVSIFCFVIGIGLCAHAMVSGCNGAQEKSEPSNGCDPAA